MEDVVTAGALAFFAAVVLGTACRHHHVFWGRYGRRHRLTGLLLFLWLGAGLVWAFRRASPFPPAEALAFDAVMAALGVATAHTAAGDFSRSRKHVVNPASGVLEPRAAVTHSEMVEHVFYQLLNGCQILFLHAVALLSRAPSGPWWVQVGRRF